MATRRPRVKPAAILKPRRQPTLVANQNDNGTVKIEDEPKLIDTSDNKANGTVDKPSTKELFNVVSNSVNNENGQTVSAVGPVSVANTSNGIDRKAQATSSNHVPDGGGGGDLPAPIPSAAPKPFRRIIAPVVNLPTRRKTALAVNVSNAQMDESKPSQAAMSPAPPPEIALIRSPSPTKAETKPIVSVKGEGIASGTLLSVPSPAKEDFPQRRGTIDNDDCFKSPPFMSPSMQYNRRQEPPSSPFPASPFPDAYGDDYAKSPSSIASNKIRQRIRPTPYFMVRRNSIQVSWLHQHFIISNRMAIDQCYTNCLCFVYRVNRKQTANQPGGNAITAPVQCKAVTLPPIHRFHPETRTHRFVIIHEIARNQFRQICRMYFSHQRIMGTAFHIHRHHQSTIMND